MEFLEEHFNLIQEQVQFMNDNPNEFMNTKLEKIATLLNKLSISLKLLELTKVSLKS